MTDFEKLCEVLEVEPTQELLERLVFTEQIVFTFHLDGSFEWGTVE